MKKIRLFYLKKISLNFLEKINNSLILNLKSYQSGFLANFRSHYHDNLTKIYIECVNFWKYCKKDSIEVSNFFTTILKDSYFFAKNLSNEFMPNLNNQIFSQIHSCIINAFNKTISINENIFYFLSNCFLNINVFHFLLNGNKRLAIAILIKLLYNFGYYFKFTNNKWKSCRDWEKISVHIINEYSSKHNEEEIIKFLIDWIIKNIVIAINFV